MNSKNKKAEKIGFHSRYFLYVRKSFLIYHTIITLYITFLTGLNNKTIKKLECKVYIYIVLIIAVLSIVYVGQRS